MGSVNNVSKGLTNEQINALANVFIHEVPGGVIDGSNTVFTVLYPYQPSRLEVYKNGQQLKLGPDYAETGPTSFTLTFAPKVGDVLFTLYIQLAP